MGKIIVKWKTLAWNPTIKSIELPAHAYNIHTEFGGWTSDRDIYLWWKEYGNDKCKKIVSTRWKSTLSEVKIEIIYPEKNVLCFVCRGDGKETCTNPDHGLIDALGFHDVGRLGCPVCGHDPQHKVKNGGACEACEGNGSIPEERAKLLAEEYGYEGEFEYLKQ